MTTDRNPLIQSNTVDTLCYIENHLRFISDYFSAKQYDHDNPQDPDVIHGLCSTLDMSLEALRYEIERESEILITLLTLLNKEKETNSGESAEDDQHE